MYANTVQYINDIIGYTEYLLYVLIVSINYYNLNSSVESKNK